MSWATLFFSLVFKTIWFDFLSWFLACERWCAEQVRFIVRGKMYRNHTSRQLLLFWVREELLHSCKEESPSLSLSLRDLLHLWNTQQRTRENAAVFFLTPTASSGHTGFGSRNTRTKRILICFLMCWNPQHRTDIAKHAAHVRHVQGIIIVGGIRIEICKDFLGFHAAHHLW
jgi:hypothetical protein